MNIIVNNRELCDLELLLNIGFSYKCSYHNIIEKFNK